MTVPANAERRPGRPRSTAADQAILDATVDLLAELGFLALTVEAVAARAGVAKTTLYRRWPNKDELVMDALCGMKGMQHDLPGESVRGDLLYMLHRMRTVWISGKFGSLMRRLAADGIERPDLYREFRNRFVAPRQAIMRAIIDRGIAEGSIRADVDRQWMIAMLVSPIITAVMTHQDRVTGQQIDFTVDTVLRGVAPD
jgi:AcrR family transcriptional regulator